MAPQGDYLLFRYISTSFKDSVYVCPVFRSNLVLFIFHSDSTVLSLFLLFGFLVSFLC